MTGYQSKKAAALDEDGMYLVHHTVHHTAQEPVCPECKAEVLYECVACSSNNYPPQPAQEPVAWIDPTTLYNLKIGLEGVHLVYETEMINSLPLYEKPQRPWVGLTDEEIDDIFWQHESRTEHQVPIYPYERAIEAKLKEKNNV